MSARRGAVKVNPVTGKMEKYDPGAVPEGKHRDGCLLVDDRYVNAAKDIGLGSEKGESPRSLPCARARHDASLFTHSAFPFFSIAQACTATCAR